MIETTSRLKSVTDKEKWVARGASFAGKVKATKLVWFPPKPEKTGKKAASAATKTTKRAAKQTTGAAKKTTGPAKQVTNPVRRKKK